jgi:uncharacterized damage-inducible protein DinB
MLPGKKINKTPVMKDNWTLQYELVRGSRAVLLDYCDTLQAVHFTGETTGFGRGGSIRNLLVHNGDVYGYWIGEHALGRAMQYPEFTAISSVQACRDYYAGVDSLMEEFFNRFADRPMAMLSSTRNDKVTTTTALEVFMHVITHEFHHKGQMLSISRQLGYTPVDTDIIR